MQEIHRLWSHADGYTRQSHTTVACQAAPTPLLFLGLPSVAVINAITESNLGRKGVVSSYRLQSFREGSQAKNLKAGAMERTLLTSSLSGFCPVSFLTQARSS